MLWGNTKPTLFGYQYETRSLEQEAVVSHFFS